MKTCKEMIEQIEANHVNKLMYLYERWQDEKEYEDFKDYVKAFKKDIPETIKGSKRPFGFTIRCSDGELKVSVIALGKTRLQVNYSY